VRSSDEPVPGLPAMWVPGTQPRKLPPPTPEWEQPCAKCKAKYRLIRETDKDRIYGCGGPIRHYLVAAKT